MARIAFIGLGRMGAGMARNLLKAGHEVIGYDLVDAALDAFEKDGGARAGSIAEAVRDVEAVVTMLPAGKHVREAYASGDGIIAHAPKSAILIDSSTIDIPTAKEVAAIAAEAGVEMVDAPVSGGVAAADAGQLAFMVGGTEEGFAMAEPILAPMSKKTVHAGPAGAGQTAKICNNMVLAISMIGVCEAFNLADAAGLDRQKLFEIMSAASGQCWSLTSYCPVPGPVPASPANNDYKAGFMAALMLKDLRLSQDAAQSYHVATPMGERARDLYESFDEAGFGEKDFSGIIAYLRERGE